MGTYDNAFGGALHDPMLDQEGALEIKVLGHHVAWTEGDYVYIDMGSGYECIGELKWEDSDDPTDDFDFNKDRLREFVLNNFKECK